MKRTFAFLSLAALLCAPAASAQSAANPSSSNPAPAADSADAAPQAGGHELQIWTGAARGVPAAYSESNETVVNLGVRYGWVLTDPLGHGPLRGRFEYAVDAIPIYQISQPHTRAYGWGFNAFALKWNFEQHRRISPYFEMTGGALFTNREVPERADTVNFVTSAGIGAHLLRGKYNWSADIRFMHISNAGLNSYNPGIDTIQFRLGFGLFTHPK